MVGQSAINALSSTANLGIEGVNWLNRNAPASLQTTYRANGGPPQVAQIPEIPQVDWGEAAKPQGLSEHLLSAGVGGGAVALSLGGVGDIPAILQGSGKEFLGEIPTLLRQAGVLGAVPGMAAEGANQLVPDDTPPGVRQGLEIATGMIAAIAAHRFAGGNPFDSVATKLGSSETAKHAGDVVQRATRDWRQDLPDKVEALKGVTYGPINADGTDYGNLLFGKIPLDTATADMTESMKVAGGLNAKLGIFRGFPEEFGDNMPSRAKTLFDRIAGQNNPIVEYPPQAEAAKPMGPMRTLGGGPEISVGPSAPQALQTVPARGEVGFHIPEPDTSPELAKPQGTVVGFKAPIADVMALRSYIGEMTSRGMMPKGSTAAQWDALYKGLTADIGNTAERYGARPEFDDYNAKTTQLYTDGAKFSKFSNDDNPGKDTAKPGQAVSNLWSTMDKDSGDLRTIREQLPEAADEIGAAYLRQNPGKFIKLLKTNPDAAKALVPNPFDRLALSTSTPETSGLLAEAQKTRQYAEAGSWGGAGYLAGKLFETYNSTHPGTPLMGPFAAAATAAVAPSAFRFAGNLATNPRILKIPASGTAAVSPLLAQPDTTE
jgi:hypothetical protein